MIYPQFIKIGDTIGITAPSDGNKTEIDFVRLDNGKRQLMELGYKVIETAHVRNSEKGRSADGRTRAAEFTQLLKDKDVKWIISAKGGEYLMEMLSHTDFNNMSLNPKWVQGYSDNTGLTFTITTNCDIATVYGNNFNDFGMEPMHKAIRDNLAIIEGENMIQHSFDFYEDGYYERITGLEGYRLDQPVCWRNLTVGEEISMTGRLLGGCFDVLLNLVGTRFDNTVNFINQYKEDGIVWYLESFALTSETITTGLWHLKEAGWFEHVKGFVFGRPAFFNAESAISYEEAILSVLEELKVPVILDADIGHKAPQMTVINGAYATISSKNGKGSIALELK
ncbi:MAG: peptidase LD-carboxypeptidase [Lachnospiraceae bacterium]|jgi:muramoyltetrapeptide carboxypeptidase LdcA involved in peptidoglycan recycling|nr:peptidase LD-carboxypeptidase [Lachnospiraceae bacterium]